MKKVLIVDDDDTTREFLKQLVETAGYQVMTASDGKSGIESVVQNQPDLVLLDVMMPEMHGYGVCHQIKSDDVLKKTKVVFLTAKNFPADRRQADQVGADGYLSKPVVRDVLISTLKTHLGE